MPEVHSFQNISSTKKLRSRLRLTIGLLLLGTLLILYFPRFFNPFISYQIKLLAEQYGLSGVVIDEITVSWNQLILKGLHVPNTNLFPNSLDDIYVESLTCQFSWKDLIKGKLQSCHVGPTTLRWLPNQGLFENILRSSGKKIDIQTLSFDQAKLEILSPSDSQTIYFFGKGTIADHKTTLNFYYKLYEDIIGQCSFCFEDQFLDFEVTIPKIYYPLFRCKTQTQNVSLKGRYNTQTHNISALFQGTIHHIQHDFLGELQKPLQLHISLTGTLSELHCQADLLEPSVIAHLEGIYYPYQTELDFSLDIPSLQSIWQANPYSQKLFLTSLNGSLQAKGKLVGNLNTLDGHLDSHFNNINLTTPLFSLFNLNTHLYFDRLNPLITRNYQNITLEQIILGEVPLHNVQIEYLFSPMGKFVINNIQAESLGGKITVHSIENLGSSFEDGYKFRVNFQNINLDEILPILNIDGLSGQAKVSGETTFTITSQGLELQDFKLLSSSETGHICYTPLPGQELIDLEVRSLLEDFHFTFLSVIIQSADEKGLVKQFDAHIKMLGYNPKYLNAYPYEFNISTTGKLGDLVSNTIRRFHLPQSPNTSN